MVGEAVVLDQSQEIATEWETKKLGELGQVVRGSSPRPAGDPRYFNGNFIPWLTVASLTNISACQLYVERTENYLTEEGAKRSRTLEQNTLIISNSGATLGVAKILNIKCCANDGVAAIINQRLGNKVFVAQYINTLTKKLQDVVATGNGQPNLNTGLIREIEIPFPPERQQKAIAQALSNVDALIENLEALIAKKRAIKTATMQQLLTCKTRLPGFSNSWQEKKLGEIVQLKSGDSITSQRIFDSGYYRCYGGNGLRGYTSRFTHDGDYVLIGRQGALCGNVVRASGKFFASEHAVVATPKQSISVDWLFYVLTNMELNKYSESSAQPGISVEKIKLLKIFLPLDIEEQEAIGGTLSSIDNDIIKRDEHLSKVRLLKQGMMQELLTGRTRLV